MQINGYEQNYLTFKGLFTDRQPIFMKYVQILIKVLKTLKQI